MRSPELERALPELVRRGLLPPAHAAPRMRAARGELESARAELRVLLYAGALALVGGASELVRENFERLGPFGIALGLGIAAVVCLLVAIRRAPAFSWRRAESDDWSLDYLLLLGALLVGVDLAFVEAKFTPLGEAWPYHLLLVSLLAGALALRCDSRLAWSLALSTFAAWRGFSVSSFVEDAERALARDGGALRWNLLVVGCFFVLFGIVLRWRDRKAHWEPLTTWTGEALALLALGAGALRGGGEGVLWSLALFAVALSSAWATLRLRRFWHFALAAVGGYVALSRVAFEALSGLLSGCLWFAASALATIALLVWTQRRFRQEAA